MVPALDLLSRPDRVAEGEELGSNLLQALGVMTFLRIGQAAPDESAVQAPSWLGSR
jgi:hypothetical protein